MYNIKFEKLFDSKKQAVTCYLSLERRYLDLCKRHRGLPCHGIPPYYKEDENMKHELKTDPEVFTHVYNGLKDFELRENDRDFKESDILILRETKYTGIEMKNGSPLYYTGREIECEVNYMLHGPIDGLMDGWVIMGIEVIAHSSTPIRYKGLNK